MYLLYIFVRYVCSLCCGIFVRFFCHHTDRGERILTTYTVFRASFNFCFVLIYVKNQQTHTHAQGREAATQKKAHHRLLTGTHARTHTHMMSLIHRTHHRTSLPSRARARSFTL